MNKESRISNLVLVIGSCLPAIALATVGFLLPNRAVAAVFSSNDVVEVAEPVKDDVYLAGQRILVSEPVQDDAYLAGEAIEVKNSIGEDLMAAGNSVTVDGAVGDDAFLAGDHVVLEEGTSVDDLFAGGRFIEVREGTTIAGDAWLGGSVIALHGTFAGNVEVGSDSVEVGPTAKIAGDLVVRSPKAPVVAPGATITGAVRHIPVTMDTKRSPQSHLAEWVRNVVTWFIASLILLYLAPRLTALVLERIYTSTLTAFGIGFLWLVVMIPLTLALFLTIVGWPLALIVILLSGLLMLISSSLLPLVVGTWLTQKLSSTTIKLPSQWQHALLGAVVVVTLNLIPVIGSLVVFVITVAIMGTLLRSLKQNA